MGGLINRNSAEDEKTLQIDNISLIYILNRHIKAAVPLPFSVWFFYKDIMGGLINIQSRSV
jgi:hypothetical protein